MAERTTPVGRFIEAVVKHFGSERQARLQSGWRNQWSSRCPAHADTSPSLSIGEGDEGQVLVSCKAWCDTGAVVGALGLRWADLFPPSESAPTTTGYTPMRLGRR